MASIKNLEMAKALSATNYVTVKKAFFGLQTKAVYAVTGSELEVQLKEYTPEEGNRLERLLKQPAAQLAKTIADAVAVPSVPIGNVRLEGCLSADRQFLAVQLFRFVDFGYTPMTDLLCFEGDTAKAIAPLLAE